MSTTIIELRLLIRRKLADLRITRQYRSRVTPGTLVHRQVREEIRALQNDLIALRTTIRLVRKYL